MNTLKGLPRWLVIVAGILLVACAIDYWQWSLVSGAIAGAVYGVHRIREAKRARHAAALAEIARLEAELGIGGTM